MRTLFIGLLLATVAAAPPSSTQPQDGNSTSTAAEHRGGPRNSARSEATAESHPAYTGRIHGGVHAGPPPSEGTATVRIIRTPEELHVIPSDGSANVTRNERVRSHTVMQHPEGVQPYSRQPRHVLPNRPVVSNVPVPGTEPPLRNYSRTRHPNWSSTWRNDHRYNWRNWRSEHRQRYHFRPYIDPFGWGYYRFSIGCRLWPGYFGSNYWIGDPGYYRLPPAPPGTHWVRYYNDALLVDTWTGEVIDVIYDFFW